MFSSFDYPGVRLCVSCVFVSIVSFFTLTAFSSIFCKTVFVDRYCLNLIFIMNYLNFSIRGD